MFMKFRIAIVLFTLIALVCTMDGVAQSSDWQSVREKKEGTVKVYWYNNQPFFYTDEKKQFKGIEFEILEGFRQFLKDTYQINLHYQWIKQQDFEETFSEMEDSTQSAIGCAGFSITPERRAIMKFSPPYMADIGVLVSSADLPVIEDPTQLKTYFSDATAVIIPGTVMENDILELGRLHDVSFNLDYVGNSDDILSAITNRKKTFGYINLPVYFMALNNSTVKFKRQNYFIKIKEGHGIATTRSSGWEIPLKAYFQSPGFKSKLEDMVSHYIHVDFYRFIETLSTESEVMILNKEKEIQQGEIQLREFQIQEKMKMQKFLMIVIIVGAIMIIAILVLLRNQVRANRHLKEQAEEIESQADQIKSINENLELLVHQRTLDLERKNKSLEEYAFITAHKLRAPLASILGLITLFERSDQTEENKILLQHLKESSQNLDKVIRSVMDSIEKAD